MTAFRLLLVLLWLGVAAITANALLDEGLAAAPITFLTDLAHPWRAQFYADLEVQLLLFAAWIVWREPSRVRGLVLAVATMLLGALFTLPYLLLASCRSGGDVRAMLLNPQSR
jgi:hypothetical protein